MRTYPVSKNESTLILQEPAEAYLTGSGEKMMAGYLQKTMLSAPTFSTSSPVAISASVPALPYKNRYYYFDSSTIVSTYSYIGLLQETFHCINPIEITQFLAQHSEIIPSLIQCYEEIRVRFGMIISEMELISDVELPDWKALFITIPVGMEYEETFKQINDLLQNWAFYQPKPFQELVTITMG